MSTPNILNHIEKPNLKATKPPHLRNSHFMNIYKIYPLVVWHNMNWRTLCLYSDSRCRTVKEAHKKTF